jgi:hypothetical protein
VEAEIRRIFFGMMFRNHKIGWEIFKRKIIWKIGDVGAGLVSGEKKSVEIHQGGASRRDYEIGRR